MSDELIQATEATVDTFLQENGDLAELGSVNIKAVKDSSEFRLFICVI